MTAARWSAQWAPAVGLADLARLLPPLSAADREEAAALLGFRRAAVPEVGQTDRSEPGASRSRDDAPSMSEPRARFLRVEAAVDREPAVPPAAPGRAEGLSVSERKSEPREPLPPTPPLAAWSTLWAPLRAALHGTRPGREPDVVRLVAAWARGECVRRIPRRARRTWAASVAVWIDRSTRLTPFWADQALVTRQLVQRYGRGRIAVTVLDGVTQAARAAHHGDLIGLAPVERSVPVLVLGDLGFYGTPSDRARWLRTARRLGREGAHLAALVPCPVRRWEREVARAWNAMAWERTRAIDDPRPPEERVEALLRLLAPTALAQPGLVRALRQLLPAAVADASTEVDAWHHPDVQAADVTGLVLRPEASLQWRARFADEVDAATQGDVRALIDQWHGRWRAELIHAETLAWIAHGLTDPPGSRDEALAFLQRADATLRGQDGGGAEGAMVKHYGRYLRASFPGEFITQSPALLSVLSASVEDLDPAQRQEPRRWALHQRGDVLVMEPAASGDGDGPGSPVATIVAATPVVWVRSGGDTRFTRLTAGAEIRLLPDEPITLSTDGGEVTLGVWERAAWAVAAGRDRYGLWAAFEVAGVQQRLRWIPPGTFVMGSPESEAGRFDDEGPRHRVTIARGYWLGETPVTQALWVAVMRRNPSRFHSDDRPVEQVSWDDCQDFLARLSGALDGFAARLPTEAEWERACRAGTATATWVGDLTLRGENDAPELDAIAWYGGNSGVDDELEEGYGSTGWPGKQYPHTKAGTHPVGRKAPNPYGLHDMLGNVYEWCEDCFGGYTSTPVEDPVGRQGSVRVFRGGSWDGGARGVRAAYRDARGPGGRLVFVGFRLAGGQAAPSPPAGEPRSGDGRGAGRAEARASAPEATTPRRSRPSKSAKKKQGR